MDFRSTFVGRCLPSKTISIYFEERCQNNVQIFQACLREYNFQFVNKDAAFINHENIERSRRHNIVCK